MSSETKATTAYHRALLRYVNDNEFGGGVSEAVRERLLSTPPARMTVYRGQSREKLDTSTPWVSSSAKQSVARQFTPPERGSCCVFKIHLMDVPAMRVNDEFDRAGMALSSRYRDEEEVIFLGGGACFDSPSLERRGVKDRGGGVRECWYAMAPAPEPAAKPTVSACAPAPQGRPLSDAELCSIVACIEEDSEDDLMLYDDLASIQAAFRHLDAASQERLLALIQTRGRRPRRTRRRKHRKQARATCKRHRGRGKRRKPTRRRRPVSHRARSGSCRASRGRSHASLGGRCR